MTNSAPSFDHRALVAGLDDGQRRALTARSDRDGLRQLSLHGGLILIVGGLIASGVAMPLPALPLMLLQGVLLVFLFTALHESIHRTAFRTVALNNTVARVCGFLLLLPPEWFRAFHFAHHRYTNDPARDPELIRPKPRTFGQYLLYLSGLPVWGSQLRNLVVNAAGRNSDSFVVPAARRRVTGEARTFLALYAALALGSWGLGTAVLLEVWILPILLGQPFLRAYLLAEHTGCPEIDNMLANSRTTLTTAALRILAWNMPYHAEHHAFPAVPFHKLPEFHRLARPHLQVTESGYAAFHRGLLRSFRAAKASA